MMNQSRRNPKPTGFTLVELIVSMTVIAIMLLVLSQMTGALRSTISRTTSQLEEFRGARNAFETITRRISQATLNAYDDLDPTATGGISASSYVRASELRFHTDLGDTLFSGTSGALSQLHHPTDAVFFQAPLGVSSSSNYATLNKLLNTCGYYIEWNSDQSLRPAFLPVTVPFRWRFRLMEMVEPSDSLTIYNYTSGAKSGVTPPQGKSWSYIGSEWFQTPLSSATPPVHLIAENVIFLALLPMVSPNDATTPSGGAQDGTSTDLSANYAYDSAFGVTPVHSPDIRNKLPPLVYVMMIAVDEKSFNRYQTPKGSTYPGTAATGGLNLDGILTDASYTGRWGNGTTTHGDIGLVTAALKAAKIDYRIFTAAVPLTPN